MLSPYFYRNVMFAEMLLCLMHVKSFIVFVVPLVLFISCVHIYVVQYMYIHCIPYNHLFMQSRKLCVCWSVYVGCGRAGFLSSLSVLFWLVCYTHVFSCTCICHCVYMEVQNHQLPMLSVFN